MPASVLALPMLGPDKSSLDLPVWAWWVTIGIAAAVLLFDIVMIARNPHVPSTKEVSFILSAYVGAAILFGLGMW